MRGLKIEFFVFLEYWMLLSIVYQQVCFIVKSMWKRYTPSFHITETQHTPAEWKYKSIIKNFNQTIFHLYHENWAQILWNVQNLLVYGNFVYKTTKGFAHFYKTLSHSNTKVYLWENTSARLVWGSPHYRLYETTLMRTLPSLSSKLRN